MTFPYSSSTVKSATPAAPTTASLSPFTQIYIRTTRTQRTRTINYPHTPRPPRRIQAPLEPQHAYNAISRFGGYRRVARRRINPKRTEGGALELGLRGRRGTIVLIRAEDVSDGRGSLCFVVGDCSGAIFAYFKRFRVAHSKLSADLVY
jgi:hypothetical protein